MSGLHHPRYFRHRMRTNNLRRFLSLVGIIVTAARMGLLPAAAAPTGSPDSLSESNLLSPVLQAKDADGAFAELENINKHPPSEPAEWRNTPPTAPEKQKFYLPYLRALTDKMKDFYTRYPKDDRVGKVKVMELELLMLTVQWGDTNQQSRLDATEAALLKDRAMSGTNHFQLVWTLALNSTPDKARPLFHEIADDAPPGQLKAAAQEELKKLDALGKPIDLQFIAVDGRKVDLAKLKGKVVLIDFWATWCGPCVGEVPDVKKVYDQFHSQGFEIIGISLDKEQGQLTQFVADHKMDWPQFFDGKYWQNKYARQFGIESIPAMWLIDKKGVLRVVDARTDLNGQVEKLLAE
jgi:peroxiredoxin